MKESLHDQLTYLYGLERFGIKLGLEVMEELMHALGQPQEAYKTVHITGTNGKGSTASFIASVFQASGYTVGLYTSPHLHRFNERVQVNRAPLTDETLVTLISEVRAKVDEKKLTPTFFEFTTALAFLYFARKNVDIAIIEVGMGGLLDATNVITPEVAIITNIGLDHVPMIGHTKLDIARNKAGIVKLGVPVVTAEKDENILAYFREICQQHHTQLFEVARQLSATVTKHSLAGQAFTTAGLLNEAFTITLLGAHQIENSCTALLALQLLEKRGWQISREARQGGLAHAQWEGRLEVVSRDPFILVDGAHNDDGVHRLRAFLDEEDLPHPSVLVLALKKDKDPRHMISEIVRLFDQVIITEGTYEPMPAEELAATIRPLKKNVEAIPETAAAIARARQLQTPDGMMLVTGSLYMIGGALETLRKP